MSFCVRCGKQIPEGSEFCPSCGAPVNRAADADRTTEFYAPKTPGQVALSSWEGPAPKMQRQPQSKKPAPKKSKLPFISIGAGAAMIVAALVLFMTQQGTSQGGQNVVTDSSVEVTSVVAPPSETNGNDDEGSSENVVTPPDTNNPPEENTPPDTSTPPSPSSPPESETPPDVNNPPESNNPPDTNTPPEGNTPPTTTDSSTPSIYDFGWLTYDAMKGNVPEGARRIVDLGSILGDWKGYISGYGWERFLTADIDAGQSGTVITLDWIYADDTNSGTRHDDNTPNSEFQGSFDGGMLEATGSGRILLTTFWEDSEYQYAVGDFTWPDGEICTMALMRKKTN